MREGAGRPGVAGTQGRVDPAGKREMVRKEGLEPSRPYGHKLLRLTRLPIPPLPHSESPYYSDFPAVGKHLRQSRLFGHGLERGTAPFGDSPSFSYPETSLDKAGHGTYCVDVDGLPHQSFPSLL